MADTKESPVLHVIIVGFHHKKGCQIEYSYPPLMSPDGDPKSNEVPSQWKHLPSLALPDGSHNFEEDTSFFHLPALDNPRRTVFGISCYRQIESSKVLNKTEDITRGTVAKSVCVLSRLPLYGQIQVKMSLITEAYFREGDFSRMELIQETYSNLNSCLSDEMLHTQQLYVGLSGRAFVQNCHQRALTLFKLLLLEKKVLFFHSPVQELCSFLLTLLSLHPGMLEHGLNEAARIVPADTPPAGSPVQPEPSDIIDPDCSNDDTTSVDNNSPPSDGDKSIAGSVSSITNDRQATGIKERLSDVFGYISGYKSSGSIDDVKQHGSEENEGQIGADILAEEAVPVQNFASICSLPSNLFGLPLNIFTGGNICQPYISLSYLDILCQPSIHGYLIGATNVLFKHKRGLADVIVDLGVDKWEISNPEIRRALSLTTEDLRFIDNVIKHVTQDSADVFLDGVGWEGGDEWVRAQFRFYLVCLLRSSLEEDGSTVEALFNPAFMRMWKQTDNYKHWKESLVRYKEIQEIFLDLRPGHPFSGQLSVSDMRLHFSNTFQNTEGGKKMTQMMSNTSKAVSGGISSARGAISSFWSTIRQPNVSSEGMDNARMVSSKDSKSDIAGVH